MLYWETLCNGRQFVFLTHPNEFIDEERETDEIQRRAKNYFAYLLAFGETKTYDAQDGLNIELTIDEVLQHYLDDAISVGIETSKADKICGIAMDPRTGEILAMSVFPTFDPNQATVPADPQLKEEFAKMTEEEQLNVIFDLWRS